MAFRLKSLKRFKLLPAASRVRSCCLPLDLDPYSLIVIRRRLIKPELSLIGAAIPFTRPNSIKSNEPAASRIRACCLPPNLDPYSFVVIGRRLIRPEQNLIGAAIPFTSPNSPAASRIRACCLPPRGLPRVPPPTHRCQRLIACQK
jgi:hypothetical protein